MKHNDIRKTGQSPVGLKHFQKKRKQVCVRTMRKTKMVPPERLELPTY